jgi:hypothetical protein
MFIQPLLMLEGALYDFAQGRKLLLTPHSLVCAVHFVLSHCHVDLLIDEQSINSLVDEAKGGRCGPEEGSSNNVVLRPRPEQMDSSCEVQHFCLFPCLGAFPPRITIPSFLSGSETKTKSSFCLGLQCLLERAGIMTDQTYGSEISIGILLT